MGGAARHTVCITVCTVALLSATPVFAQDEPSSIFVGPMMCRYDAHGYRPCADGPPPSVPAPPPYNPLPDLNGRYQVMMARLTAQVRGLDALNASGPPTSIEELSTRLDAAFVGGAYRLDTLIARRNHLGAVANASQISVDMLRDEANRREADIAAAARRKAVGLARRDRAIAQTRVATQTMTALNVRTSALDRRSDVLTTNMAAWFGAVAPPRARVVSAAAAKAHGTIGKEDLVPDINGDGIPARLNVSRPALPVGPARGVSFRAPPGGTVAEKLAAVERLPQQIETAARAVDALSPRISALESANFDLTIRVTALRQQGDGLEDEISRLGFAADNAEAHQQLAAQNEAATARNMLRAAVQTYIFQTLRDEVAVPAARRLLASNAAPAMVASLTNQRVGELFAAGRAAITAPVGGTWKNLDAFMATERVVLEGIEDPMTYALAAANELGSTGRSRADALGAAICAGQTRHALDITESAAGSLPGPLGEIARGMVGGACH